MHFGDIFYRQLNSKSFYIFKSMALGLTLTMVPDLMNIEK